MITKHAPPKARILIVEDEAIVASDIQSRLESFNYDVPAVARTGDQALKIAAESHPDLVLLDIKLRGSLDGVQVAEKLRCQEHIPVVFLTANSDDDMVQRAKLTEPLAYLLKPFESRDLKIAIEIALYKARVEREREELTRTLEHALAEAKILRGLIPVCAWCRKIRSDEGFWLSVEAYLEKTTDAVCSHGICPECSQKVFAGRSPD